MNEVSAVFSYINRLLSSFDWLGHLFLSFMFIVAIWRPQRIFNQGAFRMAMILFACSIIAPAVVNGIWNLKRALEDEESTSSVSTSSAYAPPRPMSSKEKEQSLRTMTYTTSFSHDCARVLLGIAVACGVLSLIEPEYLRRRRERAAELARAAAVPGQQQPPAPIATPLPLDEA